jgi:hypothetical protein
MLLTPEQLQKISAIVEKYHNAFIVSAIGPEAVPPEILQALEKEGLIEGHLNSIEQAYLYGQILGMIQNNATAKMGFDAFQKYLRQHPVPLSEPEQRAVKFAQLQAAGYIKGLGNKVSQTTGQLLINADKALEAKLQKIVRDKTAENIAKRETAKQLKTDLGWASEDWTRDWDRIAVTEKQNSMQFGMADHLASRFGPKGLVAKRTMPDACKHCKRLYDGPDGNPRIFPLSVLLSNGTNVGKKVNDWQAVIGTVHPHCAVIGTMVQTPHGEIAIERLAPGDSILTRHGVGVVSHAWRSWYEGQIVELTLSTGRVLRVTPNHLLFCMPEWREAGSLKAGGELRELTDSSIGKLSTILNTRKVPAGFDKFDSAAVLHGFAANEVPVTVIYLDGEFYLREGPIDMENVEWVAGDRRKGKELRVAEQPAFRFRFHPTTEGLRTGDQVFSRVSLSALGSIGCFQEALITFCPEFWGARDSVATSRDLQPAAYRLHGAQLLKVRMQESGDIEFDPVGAIISEFGPHDAAQFVRPVAIADVRVLGYKGVVYNFTVPGSHTYVTEGVISHNCQCQLIRVPDGYGFDEQGALVPGGQGGKVYKSEEALARALLREDDLQKSISGKDPVIALWELPIHIENKVGTERIWHTPDGGTDSTFMLCAYGEIVGSEGADGDPLDVFIGPDPDAAMVYIIEQQNPETGIWDEQKCLMGFSNQEQAEAAYRLHYNRPERFYLQTNPMVLDAFQRWVGINRLASAEERPAVRLVIPLGPKMGKSQVPAEMGAADSPAGNRAGGHGTATNYLVETPKRRVPEKGKTPGIDPTDLIHDWTEDEEVGDNLKRDKEVYDVSEPLRNVYPIHLPAQAITGQDSAREGTEERRRYVIGNCAKTALRPQDKVELEKSFAMHGVIATGPRGGKIIGWDGPNPIYYREGKETNTPGWMQRLVSHMGGKIVPHLENQDLIVLKVDPQHEGALEQIRKHFQVQNPIIKGKRYTILEVKKTVFEQMENEDPYKVFPVTPPKHIELSKFGKVITKETERQGEFEVAGHEAIKPPPVFKGFLCKGARVTLQVKGFEGEGAIFHGNDQFGQPIFKLDHPHGKLTEIIQPDFKKVKSVESGPSHYKPSTAKVADKDIIKPTAHQQALLDELIEKTAVVGGHVAKEYSDWLWKHGREGYVVGGAIRDLISMTAPGQNHADKDILEKLKDVDYVITGSGDTSRQCLVAVAGGDMGDLACNAGSDKWMTHSALFSGPGIDMTGMVSFTTSDGEGWKNPVNGQECPNIRVDHEIQKDTARRDFTVNTLYYDPQNKVIIDVTGMGIADAQAHVLRLAVPISEMPTTHSISLRYYKFRLRGWDGDASTHAQCRKHFDEVFGNLPTQAKAGVLYRTICKKGGTPEENLEKLRALMKVDGDEALFDKHIQKVWNALLEDIKSITSEYAKKESDAKAKAEEAKKQLKKH